MIQMIHFCTRPLDYSSGLLLDSLLRRSSGLLSMEPQPPASENARYRYLDSAFSAASSASACSTCSGTHQSPVLSAWAGGCGAFSSVHEHIYRPGTHSVAHAVQLCMQEGAWSKSPKARPSAAGARYLLHALQFGVSWLFHCHRRARTPGRLGCCRLGLSPLRSSTPRPALNVAHTQLPACCHVALLRRACCGARLLACMQMCVFPCASSPVQATFTLNST